MHWPPCLTVQQEVITLFLWTLELLLIFVILKLHIYHEDVGAATWFEHHAIAAVVTHNSKACFPSRVVALTNLRECNAHCRKLIHFRFLLWWQLLLLACGRLPFSQPRVAYFRG